MVRAALFLISLLAGLVTGLLPARAERVVSSLSTQWISVDSSFSGQSMTLFGNVEPGVDEEGPVTGPFDVIITITGPSSNRTVWRKSRQFGIWLNAEQVTFEQVPSLYHILTTRPLYEIADPGLLRDEGIGLDEQAKPAAGANPDLVPVLTAQMIRLMRESRRFGLNDGFVTFLSPSFYRAQFVLPADVANGTYVTRTFLFSDGKLLDVSVERFFVRTTGFERLLNTAAHEHPWYYGLAAVFLALFTGWLGGVAFRR